MNKLQKKYKEEVVSKMMEKFHYKNALQAPRIEKVVINSGVGKALKDQKFVDNVLSTITRISGQKPILTRAKKSISAFKTREGMIIGVAVTLRASRMYDFIDKLTNVALPRIRDFQGISQRSLDSSGNLSIGFREHIVFPEIKSDEVDTLHGLEVTIKTNAKTKEESLELLKLLGFPFKMN